jgi:hypothetical protein
MLDRQELRAIVRGTYDLQKLRIMIGNRIVSNFRAKLGQNPGEPLTDKESEALIKRIRLEYSRITDGLLKLPTPKNFKGTEVISQYTELALVHQYETLLKQEEDSFKHLQKILSLSEFYEEWLSHVKGCGPKIAGIILSEIDIHKAEYPSSIHAYAGLDVGPDSRGRSRRKEHQVTRTYTDKEGNQQTKQSITFNPFLKTKLIGVLGPSFLKSKSPYADYYYNYRRRLENHPAHQDKTKAHRHNMAIRYMVKRFLIDLYKAWREHEELPVAPEYSEAKLGIQHGKAQVTEPSKVA